MSRELFGPNGALLSDADLARVLAVAGSGLHDWAEPLTLDSLITYGADEDGSIVDL